jgi:hypothetical protein
MNPLFQFYLCISILFLHPCGNVTVLILEIGYHLKQFTSKLTKNCRTPCLGWALQGVCIIRLPKAIHKAYSMPIVIGSRDEYKHRFKDKFEFEAKE